MKRMCGLAVLMAVGAAAPVMAQTQPTAFTYQGRLTDNGSPANGAYDFQFLLFDAATNGTQFGLVSVDDVPVASGLFTARVDFGNVFRGDRRWLELWVRPGASTGAYTQLTTRQELTGTPYASGPWQTVGGLAYPQSGFHLYSGSGSDLWVDSLYGDLNFNGGTDGFFGFYNRGIAAGRTEFISSRGVNLSVANQTGYVGMNATPPLYRLHVIGAPADQYTVVVSNHSTANGNAITGTIESDGNGDYSVGVEGINNALAGPNGSFGMYAEHTNGGTGIRAIGSGAGQGVEGFARGVNAWGGYFKNLAGGVALFADGLTMVRSLQILGGSDLAEPFDVSAADAPAPGMVVVIDPEHPGDLRVSREAYDSKVAGVISGANGLATGLVMKAQGVAHADGEHPVALTGRVWCYVDASQAPVEPGDLLTTSAVPGHAMKAVDGARSRGSVIGKAMTGLKEGRGLVLVLVNLQ